MNLFDPIWFAPLLLMVIVYGTYGTLALVFGDSKKSVARKNKLYRPYISIVIPSYNEEKIIRTKLENTLEVSYPKDRQEIIVVDSSSDGTPEVVSEYARRCNYLRLIHEERREGVATALNKAYSTAVGDIVVRTDCDSLLDENAILEIVSNFADPFVGAVAGKIIVLNKEKKELRYRTIQQRIQMAESRMDSTFIIHGPFCAFRRELIKQIDPRSMADDTEVALEIRKQGYRVIYDHQAEYYEASPENFAERLELKSRRAQGLIKLLLNNIRMCFNPRFSIYGMIVFPMNFFMLIVSPVLMLVIPSLFVADLLLTRSFVIIDSLALAFLALTVLLRKKKTVSSIWAFIELQYAQLVALKNIVIGNDQSVWQKQESIRKYYVTR
ncbi:MAG: glycosyltransferase [Nitrososphaerales archaeon]